MKYNDVARYSFQVRRHGIRKMPLRYTCLAAANASVVFPKKLYCSDCADTRLQPRLPVEALAERVQLSLA